jgi:dipicolinate synthase subunit A
MILAIANDKRMTYVADELSEFFNVGRYGSDIDFDIKEVKYAVLPFKVEESEMRSLVNQLPDDCVIFTPIMRNFLEGVPQQIEIIMDSDEIAIYNSIPTAEGTIYYIMQNTEHTIHGANIHVIGAGRCGETLAKSLRALGANVSISSRNPKLVARLFESGIPVLKTDEHTLRKADVIINTVPAMMLGRDQLQQVKKEAYIADIASAPGGVDFDSAKEFGIKAELLPALPGIVAPKTAASYIVQFIRRKISER